MRRPINSQAINLNSLGESELVRIIDIVAKPCKTKIPNTNLVDEAKSLSVHLKALAKWDGGRGESTPMPIQADVGMFPKAGYVAPSIEIRCENESCDKMKASHLEVKWGGTAQPK